MAPRVGASKRILAPRLGNGTPLSFPFSLGDNKLMIGKILLAPRAVTFRIILAQKLQN